MYSVPLSRSIHSPPLRMQMLGGLNHPVDLTIKLLSTFNHQIAMSLNVTFVSVTGCSRDGFDVYRPLAAPPVGAPGRERPEEELLRREAVARPDRHRRRHCRCRLPSNNNSLLPFKSPTRCTVVLTTRYLASLASITRTLPKVNRMWRRIGTLE